VSRAARPTGLIPKAAPASKLYSILVLLLNFTINLKPPEPVYPVAEIITFSIPAKSHFKMVIWNRR
jgi:hypothetical protein